MELIILIVYLALVYVIIAKNPSRFKRVEQHVVRNEEDKPSSLL